MTDQPTQTIISKTDRPNSVSFRAGGTGTPEYKFYFNDEEDLHQQIRALADSDRVSQAIADLKTKGQ